MLGGEGRAAPMIPQESEAYLLRDRVEFSGSFFRVEDADRDYDGHEGKDPTEEEIRNSVVATHNCAKFPTRGKC